MHIEIEFEDGTTEVVPVTLEGERILQAGAWRPGHSVGQPQVCYFKRDFFEAALGEAEVRAGSEAPDADEDEAFAPFSWRLVGEEAEECRVMLRKWIALFGDDFDPEASETAVASRLDVGQIGEYRSDMQCCRAYLQDPSAEVARILAERADAPSF